ncbi:MAG TPA: hypothetical protein VGR37_08925 [Longimicrobiaceae bacterium]|nr:hypothetical protein [Longimicrobiaceae bacterium]
MKLVPCAVGATLALLLGAAAAAAQEDARVLPRGYLALKVGGEFTQFDSRLGSGADGGPLGAPLAVPLPASLFPGTLPPVRDSLARFFTATSAAGETFPLTEADVFPGVLDPDLAADLRRVPISLQAGVTSRLMLRATLPVVRRETELVSLRLAGGTIGANARGDTLAALFRRIDPSLATIGRLPYLPLAGSRAGQELQRRFRRATGDTTTLPLPTTGLSRTQLNALLGANRSLPIAAAGENYRVGDVEMAAKLQLLGGTGALSPRETGARLAVEAGVRLPTAMTTGADSLTELVGENGHAGATAAVFADVPLGARFWIGAQARYGLLRPRDVERFTWNPAAPLDSLVALRPFRREPGDRLEATVAPHFQVTDEIALLGRYGFARVGATVYTGADPDPGTNVAGLESTAAGTLHTLGVGMTYSTMGAFVQGRTAIPLEIWLAYDGAVAGSGGVPDLGRVTLAGRIWVPAWGGR